ncbi:MAG: hypothetical protein GQ552_05925 [Flavobacteriaceae bacterium]|nr:hypothetical protein [Flavobacteriaceae bacterium]
MRKQTKNLILTSIVLFVFTSIMLTSCEQENTSIDDDTLSQDLASVATQTEIDQISEGVDDIVDNTSFDFTSNTVEKGSDTKTNDEQAFLPDCVIITKVITRNSKKVTLDYGDGCTTRNKNYLSGKIIMEMKYNTEEKSINIDYSFDNFYFNGKKVEGEVHKYKIRINENGNPEATIKRDIKITWEDDSFVTIVGERKREWVEGFGNDLWGDNVFLITGNWTVTKKDGTVISVTVLEALKRSMTCRFLVSGIVEIQENDRKIVLNYGDGTCDDLAMATINGVEHEIHLRKSR